MFHTRNINLSFPHFLGMYKICGVWETLGPKLRASQARKPTGQTPWPSWSIAYVYIYIYVCTYVYIYICMYLYIYIYVYIYISIVYIFMSTDLYITIYIYIYIYIGRCQISNNSFVIVGFVPKHVDLGQQKLECIGQDSSKFLKSLSSLLPSNCPVEILMGRWWFLFQCFLGSQQENTNFFIFKASMGNFIGDGWYAKSNILRPWHNQATNHLWPASEVDRLRTPNQQFFLAGRLFCKKICLFNLFLWRCCFWCWTPTHTHSLCAP